MILIIIFTFVTIMFFAYLIYKYVINRKCNHTFKLIETVDVLENEKSKIPIYKKYVLMCQYCGKIHIVKSNE